MIRSKGIVSFLLLTFGITYCVEIAVIFLGARFDPFPPVWVAPVIAALMWAPATGGLVTVRFITREGLQLLNIRLGPWRPYLSSAFAVPALFAVIYSLTWLLLFFLTTFVTQLRAL